MIYSGLNNTDIIWIDTNKNQKCPIIEVSHFHLHTEICSVIKVLMPGHRQMDKLHNL